MFVPWRCRHEWGFPRRWPEFEGKTEVDVQRCLRCGDYRVSPIQFGRLAPSQESRMQQCVAVRA